MTDAASRKVVRWIVVAPSADFVASAGRADLPEAAEEWEKDVNDMAKEDTDVAEYVKALEDSKDAAELPEVSGDSIAKEFERYLRRRTQD